MAKQPKAPYPAPPSGTSLVDRMNLSIHLRKYIKMLTRRFWIIILCVVAFGGHAYYKAKNAQNIYQASSALGLAPRLIQPNEPVIMEPTYVHDQIRFMQSVVPKVGQKLENYRTKEGKKASLINEGAKPSKSEGSIFTLSVQADDPEYARRFADLWATEFLEFKAHQREDLLGDGVKLAKAEEQRFRTRLEQSREAVRKYLSDHEVANIKETREAAQRLLDENLAKWTSLKTEREFVEKMSAEEFMGRDGQGQDPPEKGPPTDRPKKLLDKPVVADSEETEVEATYSDIELEFERRDRESKIVELAKTLKPKHPYIVNLQNEIEALKRKSAIRKDLAEQRRKQIEEARALAKSSRLAQADLERRQEIERKRKEEDTYAQTIKEQREIVLKAQSVEDEYRLLEEQVQMDLKEFERWREVLARYQQASPNEELITILERGVGSDNPVSPNRPKMIQQGLLYGFGLGIAIVFLLHRLDDRLELAEDIEGELEEPVLGQVPHIDASDFKDSRLLITNMDQHNMFAESIRGVRSAVMFGRHGGPKQVILVSSAVPGDGKTTFTVNFAATLANAGNRVLLIDADLRRGNIHHFFSQPRENGLSEVLAGEINWQDAVHPTAIKNLDIVGTGQLPASPGELLIGPVTEEFITQARKEYDHILVDCPPLTAIDDTFCLVNLSDGLLFIVKAGQTSMRFAKNALAQVRQRGASILGIVLNGITTDHPSYYYNYYYHAYYTKGAATSDGPVQEKRPAARMAPRRRKPSIDQEAHARAGQPAASAIIAAEEQKKAELFKARRAQRMAAATVDQAEEPTNNTSKSEPAAAEAKAPVPPEQTHPSA